MKGGQRSRWLILAAVAAFVAVVFAVPALAKVWKDAPEWEGQKRTLKVYVPDEPPGFKAAVEDAMNTWNQGDNNGDWSFESTSDPGQADVDVSSSDPGAGNDGLTSVSTNVGGSRTTHMSVKVKPGLTGDRLKALIMHELGHCMRMDHTAAVGDIMNPSAQGNPTTPSDEDKKEAQASAANKGRIYTQPTYTIRGDFDQDLTLFSADPDVSFYNLQSVNFTPLTGMDVAYHVTGIGPGCIYVSADVAASAAHNEVFQLDLTYVGGAHATTTGLLWVASTALPTGSMPHAVAGNDIQAIEGVPFTLDGTASYHNSPGLNPVMGLMWTIDLPDGTKQAFLNGIASVTLSAGTYNATLSVLDYYGQTSTDTLTITVH